MSEKLKKVKKFSWTAEDQCKLLEVLKEIKEKTLLRQPNFAESFDLHTGASDSGMGATLSQRNNLIGYFSCKWNATETNYLIVERETLAIVRSFKHFKTLLLEAEVRVYCDNANSLFAKSLTKRTERWKLLLEPFNYSLQYIAGKENKGAGHLSRLNRLLIDDPLNRLDFAKLAAAQPDCPEIQKLVRAQSLQRKRVKDADILVDEKDRVVVPSQLTETFLKFFHHTLRHPGRNALYLVLKRFYKVFDVKRQIAFVNDYCYHCQTNKKLLNKHGLVNGSLSSNRPLEHVSTDILSPFKNSLFQGLPGGRSSGSSQ